MSPDRLDECLSALRWTPDILARALECDVSLVNAWLDGNVEIPMKTGTWINLVAQHHEAFEAEKPKTVRGKRFKDLASGALIVASFGEYGHK